MILFVLIEIAGVIYFSVERGEFVTDIGAVFNSTSAHGKSSLEDWFHCCGWDVLDAGCQKVHPTYKETCVVRVTSLVDSGWTILLILGGCVLGAQILIIIFTRCVMARRKQDRDSHRHEDVQKPINAEPRPSAARFQYRQQLEETEPLIVNSQAAVEHALPPADSPKPNKRATSRVAPPETGTGSFLDFAAADDASDSDSEFRPKASAASSAMNTSSSGGSATPSNITKEYRYTTASPVQKQMTAVRDDVKEGFLWKEGGKLKTIKKRFFRLDSQGLTYFKSQAKAMAIGFIDINDFESVADKQIWKKRPFCFELETKQRVWFFWAESRSSQLEWMEAIQAKMRKL